MSRPRHASTDGKRIAIGNTTLLAGRHVQVPDGDNIDRLRSEGQTIVFVVVDDRLAGYIGVADPVKPTSREAIQSLRAAGLQRAARAQADGNGVQLSAGS